MELSQIRLVVADLPAVFAFYRDVLGLRPMVDPPDGPYAAFKPDLGSTLALHDRAALVADLPILRGDTGTGNPDRAMIALRVDDLDAFLAEVTARGGHVLAGPVDIGGRLRAAYLRDPEGTLVELQQWLTTRSGGPVPPAS
jgi:lactoylglutathione lyase